MKRHTWSGIVTAAVFAISGVVMAQSPATQPSTSTQTPSTSSSTASAGASQAAGADKITVTGCLREASPAATATSGSAAPGATDSKANASAEGKYVLADATPNSSGGAASGAANSPQTYRLIANDSALAPHVGKKLEFTGTVDAKDASSSGEPWLRVEAASVVGSDCSK